MTEQISSLTLRNFTQTCKSPATREVYTLALHHFMVYLRLQQNDYDKLIEKDPKTIQMDICNFITFLRNDHSPASVSLYVA
ncbi:MAG: hypothetical protein WB815_02270, partial [Nitrososphaeraceae archaeon]